MQVWVLLGTQTFLALLNCSRENYYLFKRWIFGQCHSYIQQLVKRYWHVYPRMPTWPRTELCNWLKIVRQNMPMELLSFISTQMTRSYSKLIEHLRMSFESGETFSSLLSHFYARCQKPKETEDQFVDELQVLVRKIISVCPKWRSQVNEALKTKFAHRLQD